MRRLTVANPQSRFDHASLEYDDGEAPHADLDVFEDQSKTILSANNSPDVGFRWSVNPYRGCQHACCYCADGESRILMGDGRTRKLGDLCVGDEIYGTYFDGKWRRFTRTLVLAHWETFKRAYRVVLADGTELIASADHRFLTKRGWKHVIGAEQGPLQRPHLTLGTGMMGLGGFVDTPAVTDEYRRGYLCGMIRGDGMLFDRRYPRRNGGTTRNRQLRLALVDLEGLRRTRAYLEEADVEEGPQFMFQAATATRKRVMAFRAGARAVPLLERIIDWPAERTPEWSRGFLAGIFDAEGSCSQGVLRITNSDIGILDEVMRGLGIFRFDAVLEPPRPNGCRNVRIRGGLRERIRFFHFVNPAIRRKLDLEGVALKSMENLDIVEIADLGFSMRMFDITTGTGDFIANGVVSHNCYARPSHEYLSFGAGTDFERKIVVKPRAAELLRASFDKPSWKGERVVFSGITDCYQPLERKMELTRRCLEVCAEYKNPVGIITKSPIVERDVDLLQELTRVANVRVSVSVPFWDPDTAKAMEPMVTTPERRMRIVETLAKAGIRVGVSVSPIVPGLNDDHLGDVLERAAEAGAKHAFFVLLRLPGPVAVVFEQTLRAKLPLRAEKVLRRLREAHNGKLYDSTFGKRGRGEGVYADAIRILFERTAKRLGLADDEMRPEEADGASTFRRPSRRPPNSGQTSFGF